jgi:hypothetical protein
MKNLSCLICVFMLSVSVVPAWAGPGKKHHDDRITWDNGKHSDNDKVAISVTIGGSDRNVISNYLRSHYSRNCPPGLAKKNNGCLPPGQAKKYGVGQRFYGSYDRLPRDLAGMLNPPPGTFYAMVDKDVVLMSEATKKIVDAVTLLSAVR